MQTVSIGDNLHKMSKTFFLKKKKKIQSAKRESAKRKRVKTLKALSQILEDDIIYVLFVFVIFQRKKDLAFHVNRRPSRRFT